MLLSAIVVVSLGIVVIVELAVFGFLPRDDFDRSFSKDASRSKIIAVSPTCSSRDARGCFLLDDEDFDFHDESEEFRFQPNLSQEGTASSQMFSENEDSEVKGYNFPQSVSAQLDSDESRSKSNHLNQINKTDTRNHVGDNEFQFPACTSDSTSFVVNDAGNMKHNTPTHKFSN